MDGATKDAAKLQEDAIERRNRTQKVKDEEERKAREVASKTYKR